MTRDQRIWEASQRIVRTRITDPGEYFILKPDEVPPAYHLWHKHLRACIDRCGAGQRCEVGEDLRAAYVRSLQK